MVSEIETLNDDFGLGINDDKRNGLDVYKGWEKPDGGWVKVNCDGAFSGDTRGSATRVAGIGVVMRNEEGKSVTGLDKRITTGSVIEAEAMALYKGIMLAERDSFSKIILETDSKCIYEVRNANEAADWVATHVKRGMCFSNWVNMPHLP
ncbi:hypothetical protein PTKIN_Ptkin10aG0188900 [Pterospermum kingtungense]